MCPKVLTSVIGFGVRSQSQKRPMKAKLVVFFALTYKKEIRKQNFGAVHGESEYPN
jgi:hypothetical protein